VFQSGPTAPTVIYAPGVMTQRSGRRRAVALGCALTGALLVAGCGSGSSSSPVSLPGQTGQQSGQQTKYNPAHRDFAQVRRLLGRRAHAVLHRDEPAFMATVDDRSAALVTQQRTLFENMSQLSISSLRYVMDPTVQLVPAAVPDGDPAFRPQVVEYLQITGTTQHPVSNALEQTFVEHDHRWLVGAETTPKDNESFDSAQERPWFGVPIVAERRAAMTVLVDQARRSTLGPLTTAIHDHILFDSERLGVPPSFEILVDATSNGNATTFSSLSKEQAAAVTFPLFEADPKDTSSFRALAGHAIKINPHEAGSYADDTGLLRHELTHFLLHEYNSTSPKWLVEGIATYLQYYPDVFSSQRVTPGFYHRLMAADRELPTVGLFNDDPDVNYQIAQAATAGLVSHYGMPKLLELMRAYRSHYEGVDTDALTPRMLRLVDGVSEQQVVAGAFALLASYQH
jgi:hypothetical protein